MAHIASHKVSHPKAKETVKQPKKQHPVAYQAKLAQPDEKHRIEMPRPHGARSLVSHSPLRRDHVAQSAHRPLGRLTPGLHLRPAQVTLRVPRHRVLHCHATYVQVGVVGNECDPCDSLRGTVGVYVTVEKLQAGLNNPVYYDVGTTNKQALSHVSHFSDSRHHALRWHSMAELAIPAKNGSSPSILMRRPLVAAGWMKRRAHTARNHLRHSVHRVSWYTHFGNIPVS